MHRVHRIERITRTKQRFAPFHAAPQTHHPGEALQVGSAQTFDHTDIAQAAGAATDRLSCAARGTVGT
jgi:hypothetical protein